jgi:hypothetical protein
MPVEYLVSGNEKKTTGGVILPPARKVILETAARTLTADDHGAIVCFHAAAGFTVTLPAPAPGLLFEFQVTVSATSVAHKILTPASTFMLGHFIQSTDGTFVTAAHAANGSTIRSWNGNGSTTGGFIGDYIRLMGINATQYLIWGYGSANGTEATPFGTS